MARALVTLAERDEADGQAWHLPAAEPLTGRQFLTLIFETAGRRPKIGGASRPMIRLAGLFNPLLRELNETLYQFEQPFICDASKFERAFGPFQPTPHAEACNTRWTGSAAGTRPEETTPPRPSKVTPPSPDACSTWGQRALLYP
jgi:hypothetical protein